MKKNQLQLENTITGYDDKDFPDTADFDGETPKSEKFRRVYEDFRLPLGQNEMLIIEGPITIRGKRVEKKWLMRNGKEVYNTFFNKNGSAKNKSYNIRDLKIKKVEVFNFDEKTKTDLLYQAYNGGQAVVRTWLRAYIDQEKNRFSQGAECLKCQKTPAYKQQNKTHCESYIKNYCPKREILMSAETKPLDFDIEGFSSTMREVKDGMTGQTAKMPSQVKRDQKYLNDEGVDPSKPLTNHLYKLRGVDPRTQTKEKSAIDNFVRSVKDKCSFM